MLGAKPPCLYPSNVLGELARQKVCTESKYSLTAMSVVCNKSRSTNQYSVPHVTYTHKFPSIPVSHPPTLPNFARIPTMTDPKIARIFDEIQSEVFVFSSCVSLLA